LGLISSVTKQAGHQVKKLLVTHTDEYSHLWDEIASFKPRVVGFSVFSYQFRFVKEMAAGIKEQAPATVIVCGGPQPTIFPQALLETDVIDGFFIGESEVAFPEFLRRLGDGLPYQDTDNFAYVQNGTLVRNPLKPLIQDLDILPFSDKDDLYRQTLIASRHSSSGPGGLASFLLTRGCPFLCAYCSNHALAKVYGKTRNQLRFRSPESCIREIEEVIQRYGELVRMVSIMDDIFGPNRRWRQEFCQKYKERINKRFQIMLRAEMANDELLAMLKEAGCGIVSFGVESGNEKLRTEVLNRRISNEKMIYAFDLCRQYGLDTLAFNMIGLPGETEEMVWETIRLNRRLQPTVSFVGHYLPLRGTELGDRCFREGWIDEQKMLEYDDSPKHTILKSSEEHRKVLSDIYANWATLVNPNTPEAIIQSKRGQS
jgi:radical SAM superfamily enzyme YgiQ (UPF0313 family)